MGYDFAVVVLKKSKGQKNTGIGMLTGGGDCPGPNAVIRARCVKGIQHHGDEFYQVYGEGGAGFWMTCRYLLTMETASGILQKGRMILRSSRTNVKIFRGRFYKPVDEVLKKNNLDALIALGGDDTQSISVAKASVALKCVGVGPR